ncbi:MAG: sulfatase-like hydrolase/transferase [Verrucomicrobiaceae bacterium]|nr:sulfatase-like hydrolase/transferase [Verrucomicrobiaceae bacterium]
MIVALTPAVFAEPLVNSWYTGSTGRYARIFETAATEAAGTVAAVTTWSRGQGSQQMPTYAGVHEVSYNAANVYVRSTGLGAHIMGPWYLNSARTNLFPNYPANLELIYRIPRDPGQVPAVKALTGLGRIGLFVDGVSMFDSRDAFSYDTSAGEDDGPRGGGVNGDDVWNRDAYVNEGVTFDAGNAHQAGRHYHYHANPPGLRHLLGDSVDYIGATNTYTENFNGSHSPILGWVRDGYPLYGPYGFSDAMDPDSGVTRMRSGFRQRNISQRRVLPAFAARDQGYTVAGNTLEYTLPANRYGPDVTAGQGSQYEIGHYLEDYEYLGDLGFTQGTAFDLDLHNGRFCVTPEFPQGTYAYFVCIEESGEPKFPYNIGRTYYGNPRANTVNVLPADAQVVFEGGPEKKLENQVVQVGGEDGEVTLSWSTVEGGTYLVERSDDLERWEVLAGVVAEGDELKASNAAATLESDRRFYRARLLNVDDFDDGGFDVDLEPGGGSGGNNVLLLILDDWGIDASELYNSAGAGIQLANMTNLRRLLYSSGVISDDPDKGLLFTRGYSQPICSPTRATLLTGRQTYQHGVGNPGQDSTLPAGETTFPEIISAQAPQYGLASFGKWHLGSGNTGPRTTGGWPNFSGTLQGRNADYNAWTRIKIEDGTLIDRGTAIVDLVANGTYTSPYATTVQVDEAVSFINSQGDDPWVIWMGFNAPHDPFQDPPEDLAPEGGYSTTGTTNKDSYIRMLEALDTEIGRLLDSVDLDQTNIIVLGDNGTPNQVDQPPSGGIAAAKGSLNEGGIHVPFFATGPDINLTGTTDTLVHVADLFTTVLDLTGIDTVAVTEGLDIHSTSLVPVFNGNDTAERCMIAEKWGINAADGRSLIMDQWPQYKLISIQDVTDPDDTPDYQMYLLGSDGVEASTLTTPPNAGDAHEEAYNVLVAKDQSLEPPVFSTVTVHIDLPATGVSTNGLVANLPALVNNSNGNIVRVMGITIGGEVATWANGDITVGGVTSSAARVDENGVPDRASVVAQFNISASSLVSGQSYPMVVTFRGGGGNSRIFTATNEFQVP